MLYLSHNKAIYEEECMDWSGDFLRAHQSTILTIEKEKQINFQVRHEQFFTTEHHITVSS